MEGIKSMKRLLKKTSKMYKLSDYDFEDDYDFIYHIVTNHNLINTEDRIINGIIDWIEEEKDFFENTIRDKVYTLNNDVYSLNVSNLLKEANDYMSLGYFESIIDSNINCAIEEMKKYYKEYNFKQTISNDELRDFIENVMVDMMNDFFNSIAKTYDFSDSIIKNEIRL